MHIPNFKGYLSVFILAIVLFPFQNLQAQALDHVQGELLAQFDPSTNMDAWEKKFNSTQRYDINIKKRISPILDLYVIGFDFTQVDEEKLLITLLRQDAIYMAQYNHFVTLRSTIPNDPQFEDQWQYINLGQDGGTVGADIDMDLAWDFTTGGITANGDTIVACIIDDGIDGDHPDMAPNLFLNYAEIPGNGIDDDNNGFIDDYRGWRTGQDNDNVYTGGGHGTPVAGIVGAKGNNEIGVSGVNWDVKLMIVRGGTGVESEVLEAYSYPLIFRRKYNESNGAEGAFVVSTNASWGINQGQPSDAPLWCAFYDTLGAEGILNCGATANANFDIDVVSDLPTGCSSEYMIAVTNMNRNDVKVNSAGYGLETIDLGAFGAETWTAASNGGYGGFGGTSGATPHVTGTIALMYAAPCSNLATQALNDPSGAAEIVRDAIFDGVDPNASLEGITVTGGRLNVHNAVNLLLQNNCGDCPPPLAEAVELIDENSVNLNWTENDSINVTDLRWRAVGSADWTEILDADSPLLLSDLSPCVEYEYQFKAYCPLDTFEYGLTNTFVTAGCCENPDNIAASDLTETSGNISWDEAPYALSYNLRYKPVSETDWIELNTSETSIFLDELISCNEYEVQLQSVCNLASPDYTASLIFFIGGCDDACLQIPYCEVTGYDSDEEWIALVTIGNMENQTGGDNGYGEYLDIEGPSFIKGGTYEMSLTPGYSGNTYEEVFLAWMDINSNGSFEEDELVFSSGGAVTETTSGFITIPTSIDGNSARLRIAMRYQNLPVPCVEENFNDFGEVEDYCLSFGCPMVQGFIVDSVSDVSADITILGDDNADDIEYQYRKVGDLDWINVTTPNLNIFLEGLEFCTDYEIQARTLCGDETTEYNDVTVFKTSCELSINDDNSAINLSVQPNPFHDQFTVKLNSIYALGTCNVTIINSMGAVVEHLSDRQLIAGENSWTVQSENYQAGLYFIRISNDEVSMVQKMIKID